MAYATAADLDALVQDSITAATATLLLDLASGEVDGYVRKPLTEDSYTETFDEDAPQRSQDGKRIWLVPANWPVTLSQVDEDGTTLTVDDDYKVTARGELVRLDSDGDEDEWGDEVKVTYTTGFPAGATALSTAKRIVLEVAARAAANPQHLDSLTADGVAPSFVSRDNNLALPPVSLTGMHKRDLKPWQWRRMLA